jgi:hypothetical protein
MAVVYRTTLVPGKVELLSAWLPGQDWYRGRDIEPALTQAGGFRLDDPAGEVGIEFMVVNDGSGDDATAYSVPMTYRGSALADADDALIGTTEHGVLGRRWVYDGTRDPVLLAQVTELIQGRAQAQAQRETDTPDLTVLSSPVAAAERAGLDLQFARVLRPMAEQAAAGAGEVTVTWKGADGRTVRGVLITAQPGRA